MGKLTVWQVDKAGALMYECSGVRSVGWLQVKIAPPAAPAGYRPVWKSSLDPKTDPQWAEDGEWELQEDHRKDDLWVARGETYTVGTDHEGVSYDGLGPLPGWLYAEEPPAPPLTLEQLRESKQAANTAKRWEVMTGGITLPGGVLVGTAIDDQNRITSVVANAALAGLADTDSVDFKAQSGWVMITVAEVKSIAGAVGQFVQACYSVERAHHDAIEAITDDYAELQAYDVSVGWPGSNQEAQA